MHLILKRNGMNGELSELIMSSGNPATNKQVNICKTIELPWKGNTPMVSSIPKGTYTCKMQYSPKFKQRMWAVQNVSNRSGILFHMANNSLKELQGCVGTVSEHVGNGKGTGSAIAYKKFLDYVSKVDSFVLIIC